MPTIKLNQFRSRQFGGVSPFGNLTTLPFKLATAANGSAVNANSTAAIALGDKVVLFLSCLCGSEPCTADPLSLTAISELPMRQ